MYKVIKHDEFKRFADKEYGEGYKVNYKKGVIENRHLVPKRSDKIRTTQKFGIELECGVRSRSNSDFVIVEGERDVEVKEAEVQVTGDTLPLDINVVEVTKTIKEIDVVRLEQVGDGSVSTNLCNVEFVSPILGGSTGEGMLKSVIKNIRKSGVTVNRSCGFHVHVDTNNYNQDDGSYQKLFGLYYAFEDLLYSFVPKTRKQNHYCKPVKNNLSATRMKEILQEESFSDLAYFFFDNFSDYCVEEYSNFNDLLSDTCGSKYCDARYFGINYHILFREYYNGNPLHVEFRHHSGTMNERKVLEWVNLCTKIVEVAPTLTVEKISSLIDNCSVEDMFSVLKINKASREYFLRRMAKFSDEDVVSEGEE